MSQMIDLVEAYNEGMKALQEKRYYDAAKLFVEVEDIFDNADLFEELDVAQEYVKKTG